ncbi:hypothetical protein DIPPA_06578 [Diplonema papillatum]|nr:hypothetical protein DIPPA_06578 [Diplonema papillatum]
MAQVDMMAIHDEWNTARATDRPVAWENALRLWRIRRQVKKYKAMSRRGDIDQAKSALNQYNVAADQVARLMQIDPLVLRSGPIGATASKEKLFKKGDGEQFAWRDPDYTEGAKPFVPQEVQSILKSSAVLETSGDRRKKTVAEARMRSTKQAEERLAKRRKTVSDITSVPAAHEQGEKDERMIRSKDWEGYKASLEQQKAEVLNKSKQLAGISSAKERFADILSDSD